MRDCVFRTISYDEAIYVSEYCNEELGPGCVIVHFTDGNKFVDRIHIDDGDMSCLQLQKKNKMKPIITR